MADPRVIPLQLGNSNSVSLVTITANLCSFFTLPTTIATDRDKMACWLSGQPVKAKPDNHEQIKLFSI